jgi:hypothetical protein
MVLYVYGSHANLWGGNDYLKFGVTGDILKLLNTLRVIIVE